MFVYIFAPTLPIDWKFFPTSLLHSTHTHTHTHGQGAWNVGYPYARWQVEKLIFAYFSLHLRFLVNEFKTVARQRVTQVRWKWSKDSKTNSKIVLLLRVVLVFQISMSYSCPIMWLIFGVWWKVYCVRFSSKKPWILRKADSKRVFEIAANFATSPPKAFWKPSKLFRLQYFVMIMWYCWEVWYILCLLGFIIYLAAKFHKSTVFENTFEHVCDGWPILSLNAFIFFIGAENNANH